VVSPGDLQWERDYVAKRAQYEDLGIPEYWIINPQDQTVLVLEQNGQGYRSLGLFRNEQSITSPQFSDWNLTADQLFAAGHSDHQTP
jgi:Uma2 family endonuclease